MNIFNKVTLQCMKKSRTRTIVTVIGVALSAAMITAVATFGISLLIYMTNGAAQKYGDWHIVFLDAPSSFVQERSLDKEVAGTAAVENIGYATLDGGKNPDKPYLFIAGFTKDAYNTLPLSLVSGRLPENSGEILVPAHVAANGGIKFSVGETLSLAVGTRMDADRNLGQHDSYISGIESGTVKETLVPKTERSFTIVGICERPAFEEAFAPGYTLITTTDPADQTDSFSIFVTLTNPRQVHTYANHTSGGQTYTLNDNVLRFMGLSDDTMFNALLYSVGGVLVVLIMIGSIFLIYNSFHISLNERTRQFGILSSVGATPKQLRNSVLFEGLCIGAAGIPIGIIVGIGSIGLVIDLIAGNLGSILYGTVPLTLTVSTPIIAAAAVVSMVTILISAYIPARKAANTPVMESIRQTNEIKIEAKAVKTSTFVHRIYGLEGTLALKNFKRNKKRYRSIVLSLTLSVVLFVSASAFGIYLKKAAEQSVVNVDYDICFSTQEMDESELFRLYDILQTADGVYSSSYQAIMTYSCAVKAKDFSDRSMNFRIAPLTNGEPMSEQGQNIDVTFVDTIPLDTLPRESTAPKSTVFMVVAPYQLKERFEIPGEHEELGLTFRSKNPFQSVIQIETMIKDVGVTSEYSLHNVHKTLEENRNIIFVVDVFTYVFVFMISLIAIANVFNTISTNIKLRKRELAMLRSVGMSDRDFKKMMNFECAFYGMRTLLFGLPIASIFSWLIYNGLIIGGMDTSYVFPWGSIVISVFGVFFVVFVTMLYAITKIKRENIIDALRDDMT